MPGILFLCATPIGNLDDASPRLASTLDGCDVVFCEDTRRTAQLLRRLGVSAPLRSYFAGNEADRAVELSARIAAGDTVGLVTDAGMPGVSDPGYSAVRAALDAGGRVSVVPGPSAVTAALAASDIPAERFVFEGFLPRRGRERRDRLEALAAEERAVVVFSAKTRLATDLTDLAEALGGDRQVAVGRELTKLHEEVWRGDLATAAAHWGNTVLRGEFTLVIAGAEAAQGELGEALARVAELRAEGASMADAVRQAAEETRIRRRRLYEAALRAGM